MFGRSATLVGGGVGAVVVILLLLALVVFGHCSLPFRPAGLRSAASPSPTVSASVAPSATPTVAGVASPSPSVAPSSAPSASPSPSPSPTVLTPSPSASPSAPVVAGVSFPVGEDGVGYGPVALSASGGSPPYRWSVSGGALPAGLSLSSGGVVGGTPSGSGGSFTVKVSDAAGQSGTAAGSITIVAALAVGALCAATCYIEVGCASGCLTFGNQSGGVAPYTYSSIGALPGTLSGLSMSGGFSGSTFSQQFTTTVSDALGVARSITSIYQGVAHVATPKSFSTSFSYGQSGTFSVPYSGGRQPYAARLVGAPAQATIQGVDTTNDVVVVNWAGTTAINGATYNFTLVLQDGLYCSPGAKCATQTAVTLTQIGG